MNAIHLIPLSAWRRTGGMLLLSLAGLWYSSTPLLASELVELSPVELVADASNDGDSFHVSHHGEMLLVRLYYVDCPEISAGSSTDARRVRDQTRYFGLRSHRDTVHFGQQAAEFVREQLAEPFVIHTAYATAPGRSVSRRIYVFVTTSKGEDLATLLVEQGLARAYGFKRETPDGMHVDDMEALLSDYESAAMLDRRGIWAATDSRRLVDMRATTRREAAELREISASVRFPAGKIDINEATLAELEMLPGVGPVTAQRILAHRPIDSADALLQIPRITEDSITNLLPHLKWD